MRITYFTLCPENWLRRTLYKMAFAWRQFSEKKYAKRLLWELDDDATNGCVQIH